MSWQDSVASFLAGNPVLARLALASLELLLLSAVMTALMRWRRGLPPRLVAFLWLIVLAKPLVSLAVGAPLALGTLRAPPLAFQASAEAQAVPAPFTDVDASAPLVVEAARAVRHDLAAEPSGPVQKSSASALTAVDPARLVLGAWLLGVAGFSARYLRTRWRLARIVARARAVPAPFAERLAELARELDLSRWPELLATDELESPALVGVTRPVLLLPGWMVARGWTASAEWALRHELGHYRWRDSLAIFVRDAAAVLFHFHPAAWWAGRRHVEALELACDQDALRHPSQATAYAEGLVEILTRMRERRSAQLATLAMATHGRMARRIEALLDGRAARPLTRFAAAGVALIAAAVFAFGFTLERAAAPSEAREGARAHDPENGPPSLFVLGPGVRFKEISNASRGTLGDVWGRSHEQKIYDDLFENESNPFGRRGGDLLVILLTLESGDQVPEKYEAVLPVPWAKLRARLEGGETFEESGKSREMMVLALGAPDRKKLAALILESKALAAMLGSPVVPLHALFLLGPLGSQRFDQVARAASSGFSVEDVWGRPHEEKVYDDLFKNKADPFHRRPGDLLVLLLTLEPDGQLPRKYEDLLPSPWAKVRARLEGGDSVEEAGAARDMQVLVLAAPDRARLETLVLASKLLSDRLGVKLSESEDHDHSGSGHSHDGERPPDVFVMGGDKKLFQDVVDNTSRGTYSKTGRAHDERIYDEIFAPAPNDYDRSDGDLMVLLFSLDRKDRLPAKYQDLLPRPWAEIEAALKKGETVELQGEARGLKIVVLAAPKRAALSDLIKSTPALAPYRPEAKDGSGGSVRPVRSVRPLGALPGGSRYVVTFDAEDRRVARVQIEIGPGEGVLQLAMSPGASHVERGYAHFVRSCSAIDADGVEHVLEPSGASGFDVALDGRPVTVQYQVALEHDASPWPEGGPDEGPYATDDDVFWTGRALFLLADFEGVEVEFHLPRGWTLSTPWQASPGRSDAFQVSNPSELRESFLLAGSHAQYAAQSGDTLVCLAVGRSLAPCGAGLRDAVQRVLEAGRALFGGSAPGRKLLVANRGGRGLNGGVFGNSISLLTDGAFDAAERERWAPFVAHELVHLWNGGAGLVSRERDYWFSEGFTEYYAYVLCARLGLIDRQAFVERVGAACQAYLAHAGSIALRDAAQPGRDVRALQYDGGLLAALVLDLRLRRQDPARGLDDLMRALFARHAREPYSTEDVAAVAAEQAGGDLDGFFAKYISGTEVLPLEEELARAGLLLESAGTATALQRDYAIHEVLRIRSLTQTAEGLVVRKSTEAGYQDGDRLVAIDGRSVRTFTDLQEVLAGARPGTSAALRILRGTTEVELPLRLGGRENPPVERLVEVQLRPEGDTSTLDHILRASKPVPGRS